MDQPKMPEAPMVPLDLWLELYAAAIQFQILAPWRWMGDRETVGIDNQHGVRMLSVLGGLGEVFGLAGYRGTDGINQLLLLRSGMVETGKDSGYCLDALLVDFSLPTELAKEDLAVIKAIEFKPCDGEPRRYPSFRSHLRGFVPWFVNESEARQLTDNFHKAVQFALLIRQHPTLFAKRDLDEIPFFPAAATEPLTPDQLTWHKVLLTPATPDPPITPQAFVNFTAIAKLPKAPEAVWELDASFSPARILRPPRPFWSKLGLVADAGSGMVLGMQTAGPETTLASTAAKALDQALRRSSYRPGLLRVTATDLALALVTVVSALEITLEETTRLPMIEEARGSFEEFLSHGD